MAASLAANLCECNISPRVRKSFHIKVLLLISMREIVYKCEKTILPAGNKRSSRPSLRITMSNFFTAQRCLNTRLKVCASFAQKRLIEWAILETSQPGIPSRLLFWRKDTVHKSHAPRAPQDAIDARYPANIRSDVEREGERPERLHLLHNHMKIERRDKG